MLIAVALLISLGAIVGGILLANRGAKMDVAEWSVGGRRFGTWLFWFLLVGETFTTFALLGASAAVYVDGAPGYYILGTVVLTAAMGYWILPKIWRAGKRHNLMTEGDFFAARFDAPWLGSVIAVFGIVGLLMYSQVQFTGLGLILSLLVGGSSPTLPVILGGVAVIAFILVGGMRSAAFGAVVKDISLIVVIVILAISVVGITRTGSLGGLFDAVAQQYPRAYEMPGNTGATNRNIWWWMSFLLLAPVGAYVLPHMVQVTFSAKSATTIRKNQIIQPLYSLFYVLIVIIAYGAMLTVPGLTGTKANGALLTFAKNHFSDVVVGVLAGTGILVALVPTAVILLACASLFTRNIWKVLRPDTGQQAELRISRVAVIALTVIAVVFTIASPAVLVNIMVSVYSAISQLFPGLLLALVWRRTTAFGVLAGVLVGSAIALIPGLAALATAWLPAGVVPGLPAMLVNLLVVAGVSLLTRPPSRAAIAVALPESSTEAPV